MTVRPEQTNSRRVSLSQPRRHPAEPSRSWRVQRKRQTQRLAAVAEPFWSTEATIRLAIALISPMVCSIRATAAIDAPVAPRTSLR